jgi:hypothetical protein
VKFEGVVDVEIAEVKEDGNALMNGTWRTAKAKGHIMVNDIDFDYDVAKKDDKPKKAGAAEDPRSPASATSRTSSPRWCGRRSSSRRTVWASWRSSKAPARWARSSRSSARSTA